MSRKRESRAEEEEMKYPRKLLIGLTNLCNTHCRFCYRRDLNLKPKFFPFERYKTLLDEFGSHLDELEFSGIGESLLHKDFKKFALYARRKFTPEQLDLRLTSNGSLLTEDIRKFLVKQRFKLVWVSLNAATPETHLKIMPGLDFDKICTSIHELAALRNRTKSKLPHIFLTFLVTKDNYLETEDFVKLALKLGANKIRVQALDKAQNPRIFREQKPPKEKFLPILKRLHGIHHRVKCEPKWVFFPETYPQVRKGAVALKCNNTEIEFGIFFTSGEVTFCCNMAADIENKENCIGNIYEQSGLEIWNGKRATAFRKSLKNIKTAPDICKRCLNYYSKKWIYS